LARLSEDDGGDELMAAWCEGYRRAGTIHEKELWTFIMIRRIGLLAGIGSHTETGLHKSWPI
jgi:hypothetical protein